MMRKNVLITQYILNVMLDNETVIIDAGKWLLTHGVGTSQIKAENETTATTVQPTVLICSNNTLKFLKTRDLHFY